MEKLILNAETRSTEGKISEVRAAKMIPAVVYGKSQEPISIKINYSEFLKLFRVSGESHIINLKVGKKSIDVLVHDLQRHPVSGDFRHIDFFAITKGQAVTTHIHFNFIGESAAVKEGAILDEHLKEIEVKCLPTDLVDSFDVDLSKLVEMGDHIKVSDLALGDKFEVLTNADGVVVSATIPKKVEEVSNEAPDAPVTGADEPAETTEA